jgi:hypothetical protein
MQHARQAGAEAFVFDASGASIAIDRPALLAHATTERALTNYKICVAWVVPQSDEDLFLYYAWQAAWLAMLRLVLTPERIARGDVGDGRQSDPVSWANHHLQIEEATKLGVRYICIPALKQKRG